MTAEARVAVLGRIRTALRDVPDAADPNDTTVDRDYRRTDDRDLATRLALFCERLDEYRATVHRCGPDDVAATIAAICAERGARRLIVPPDLPDAWWPASAADSGATDGSVTDDRNADGGSAVTVIADQRASTAELDTVDGVITGCAVAVAETGTIVLDAGVGQGRRAITLVPDLHVCVVRADQVVALVPEAVERLRDAVERSQPLTWISGPSATSDIELSRVEGVHGPRQLHVLLVASSFG